MTHYVELATLGRREFERIVGAAVDRRPFVVAYGRSTEVDHARIRTNRNAARWSRRAEAMA